MRACAEVNKFALPVKADDGVLRQIADELHLVRLAQLFHVGDGFRAGQLKTLQLEVLLFDLDDFLFNRFKISGREGFGRVEVVVKSVFDRGADGKLHIRVQAFHSLRQHVGCGVAVCPTAALIRKGEQLERAVAVDGRERIGALSVDFAGDGGFAQAGADGFGHVKGAYAFVEFADGTVRKRDLHGEILLVGCRNKVKRTCVHWVRKNARLRHKRRGRT